jgi:hypothetical protein
MSCILRPSFKKPRAWGVAQWYRLVSMCKVLGLIPSTTKQNQTEKFVGKYHEQKEVFDILVKECISGDAVMRFSSCYLIVVLRNFKCFKM